MKSKWKKWLIRASLILLLLFLLFDLWVLFFFSVEDQVIEIASNPKYHELSIFDLTQVKVRWIDSDDDESSQPYQKLATAVDAWQRYVARTGFASGNPSSIPAMTPQEYQTLWNAWLSLTRSDRLAFPLSPAEPAEIQEVNALVKHKKWKQLSEIEQDWTSSVLIQKQLFEVMLERELPTEELISIAKSLPTVSMFCLNASEIAQNLHHFIPDDQTPLLYAANARWLKALLTAVSPNPEPMSSLLLLKEMSLSLQLSIQREITTFEDTDTYQQAIREFTFIDFRNLIRAVPDFPEMQFDPMQTIKSLLVWKFTESGFFRVQSSFVQSFCTKNSRAYTRQKVLPLQTLSLVLPQMLLYLDKIESQLNEIYAKQQMATLILELAGKRKASDTVDLRTLHAIDPFSEQPIKIKTTQEGYEFRSAGYNGRFDDYDDMIWEIRLQGSDTGQ
jgi:hypothetical protein